MSKQRARVLLLQFKRLRTKTTHPRDVPVGVLAGVGFLSSRMLLMCIFDVSLFSTSSIVLLTGCELLVLLLLLLLLL
jgi:protein-S-isoprenylcysteine O-methyltransferase Ste14